MSHPKMAYSKKELDDHLRKDPDSGKYLVVFKDKSGKQHERTTGKTRIEDARKALLDSRILELEEAAKVNRLTQEALTVIMAERRVTCAAALDEWQAWRKGNAEPTTVFSQESQLRAFVRSYKLESRPVSAIQFEMLNEFVNAKDAGSLSTRQHRLAAIRSFFDLLTAKAYCVGNPAKMVKIIYRTMTHEEKEKEPAEPFTAREFKHLIAQLSNELKELEGDKRPSALQRYTTVRFFKWASQLSYWAGLRISDICSLEWSSITPEEVVVWTRKGKRRLALPIAHPVLGSGALAPVLLDIMSEHSIDTRFVFPREHAVLTDPTKRAKVSVAFGRILERYGIEGRSFHSLRHSFATRLKESGLTVEEIGRYLAHAPGSSKVTEGYIHR